jgi:hypothetical protein
MRIGLAVSTACLLLAPALALSAGTESFTGRTAWEISRKTTCGTLAEGVTRYGIFEGRAYSRVPGEKDRHLFDVLGINTRQCASASDPDKGEGFRSVSREIMLYLDPQTGEVLDTWNNPFTGETVEVMHVANDPVNMRAVRYEADATEISARRYGDTLAFSSEIPLFYDNPLGGDFQDYVGGTYHAMEIFNNFYPADALLDSDARVERSVLGWTRVAQWLPWMRMGSKPGLMVINASGTSVFDADEIPDRLRVLMDERFPAYFTPPPLNDARPNETSWTVFRKAIEAQQP